MRHERFDLSYWVKKFPLAKMNKDTDITNTITGPLPVAYMEQAREKIRKQGGNLGPPTPVDLCIWNLGDSPRRDVTKIGGVPFWPEGQPWPRTKDNKPFTFVAQFCFADSVDIVPKLPGDILVILAPDKDYQRPVLHWFSLRTKTLLPPGKVPKPRWRIQPCHAVLHRTAEYPEADYKLFEDYRYPMQVKWFTEATKIAGYWDVRGDLPEADETSDERWIEICEESRQIAERQRKSYLCQVASVVAAERQPYLNVAKQSDLSSDAYFSSDAYKNTLMIGDVGGLVLRQTIKVG
jgi:hypothetical protein